MPSITQQNAETHKSPQQSVYEELIAKYPPATLLVRIVRGILKQDKLSQRKIDKYLATARIALDALPLDTEEYTRAAARLTNAQRYFRRNIPGAAKFELRTLSRKLRDVSDA